MSYTGHTLGESYPTAEMQSMDSTAQANWAETCFGSGEKSSWKLNLFFLMPNFIQIFNAIFYPNFWYSKYVQVSGNVLNTVSFF